MHINQRRNAMSTSPKTSKHTIDLPISSTGTTLRVIIVGRGTLTGSMVQGEDGVMRPSRKLEALRLRKKTMDRVRSLVAGPAYLAVDVLLQRACDVLEQSETVEAIRAEDLED